MFLNWQLASDSVDYLAFDNVPTIAQQFWSLSVEEQFYLIWPLLILLTLWLAKRVGRTQVISSRSAVRVALSVVFVASLSYSIIETARVQPVAFFVTPTRAWEFAAGGLVALLPALPIGIRARALFSWLMLGVILAASLMFDAETPFPGAIALFPVLATAWLLWLDDSGTGWSPQSLAKARPIQWLGDNSYSIYLWHWPILMVATVALGRPPGWLWAIPLIVGTFAIAFVTKRFIEDPARNLGSKLSSVRPVFGFMLAGVAVTVIVTIIPVQVMKYQTERFEAQISAGVANETGCFGAYAIMNECANPFAITETVQPKFTPSGSYEITEGEYAECVPTWFDGLRNIECAFGFAGSRTSGTDLFLVGDSHAEHLIPAFRELSLRENLNTRVSTWTGCSIFVTYASVLDNSEACLERTVKELLTDDEIGTVVFAYKQSLLPEKREDAAKMFEQLRRQGKQVIIWGQVPGIVSPEDPSRSTAAECIESSVDTVDPCRATPDWIEGKEWISDVGLTAGARLMDPKQILCTRDGVCHSVIGGTIVYGDSNHFTPAFSTTLWSWLRSQLGS